MVEKQSISRQLGDGRGGEIRTHDLYVPNVALYQAKLRPDIFPAPSCEGGVAQGAAAPSLAQAEKSGRLRAVFLAFGPMGLRERTAASPVQEKNPDRQDGKAVHSTNQLKRETNEVQPTTHRF